MDSIPQEILDADHRRDEEIEDLRRELEIAIKCDKLFFSPLTPNFFCSNEVIKKLEAKVFEEPPILAYLLKSITLKQPV